ncbi:HNH endonuclease [Streptomyces sp. NBC_01558]|uniref:HNH endonuclease n=1 Tax=Streptomyces sp. NBC_01558 TaxID=2975878 RepID=UPI002DDB01A1|nr:HNH endonuclease [Streptomyces sp. NBC_01558]WSD80036.1 HNH endonuclease [Streptomyces sp. NBC_01558]
MTTAWLMLALGERREHGGNDGYDDDPAQHYSWDSTVQNHARVAVGDVIALWDRRELIGVSVIEAIETGTAEKTVYFCPECKKADIKRRKHQSPAYRCGQCSAEFDPPGTKTKAVTTYRSRHGTAGMHGRGLLSGRELRALCDSPNSQLSMRPARWEKLRDALLATGQADAVASLVSRQHKRVPIPGGHRLATVRTRVGQDAFRTALLREQGEACAISGPAPAIVLEAAHLYSYAETGEHHDFGGLLLRRDLHRLFDNGLIAIDPDTNLLDTDPALDVYPDYVALHGKPLAVSLRPEHRVWLAAHWNTHRTAA